MIIIKRSTVRRWLIAGLILVAAGVGVLLLLYSPVGTALQEQIAGETPQAKVQAYVAAIQRRDRAAAISMWGLVPSSDKTMFELMDKRRVQMTDSLLADYLAPGYEIVAVEWWSTCCEPRVIGNPREAGGARMQVRLTRQGGAPFDLTFDVFTREPFWGAAAGYPFRQWVIRDIYLADQAPLFWQLSKQ